MSASAAEVGPSTAQNPGPASPQPQVASHEPNAGSGVDDGPASLSKPSTRAFRSKRHAAPKLAGSSDHQASAQDPTASDSDEEFWRDDGPKPVQHSPTRPKPNFPRTSPANPFSTFAIDNNALKSKGKVSHKDGRLHISLNGGSNQSQFTRLLGASVKHHLRSLDREEKKSNKLQTQQQEPKKKKEDKSLKIKPIPEESIPFPKLNIVVMVIGSRGDIQPFIKIGRVLKEKHGHRVRIATHPAFKKFVEEDCGLEFFSVGGNPSELMAFMVKNPGMIPSVDTILKGEIGRRRDQMAEMFEGFWRACIDASDDPSHDQNCNDREPFIADAIIANPPSFAHVHCAERLGCPLHIIFTFPYTPTQAFPHPLANIKQSNVDASYANLMSYPLVEMMTWQGLGDLVNDFREKTLGLDPVSTIWAPGQLQRLKVPYTYLWSPGLCPKPEDWGSEIDIAGFVFLDLASHFKPPQDLQDFLEAGESPIYIGFGSIVIDDPDAFTKMIFEAVDRAGVRAIVNKGWGGIGGGEIPDNVFMIDNVPHDWLFPRCKAVVHHGGAGTTAIGLKCAKPTMIVPFFGDQPFWGNRVAEAKAGAHECIPYKDLDVDKFVEGIKQCLTEEAQKNVQEIADSIEREGDGAENAVQSFLARLPMSGNRNMRCSVLRNRSAVWKLKGSGMRLSALAAELLISQNKLAEHDLRLYRQHHWNDFQGSGGPLTGGAGAVVKLFTGFSRGVGSAPYHVGVDVHERARHHIRKMSHEKRKKAREEKRAKHSSAPDSAQRNNEASAVATHSRTSSAPETINRSSSSENASLSDDGRKGNDVPVQNTPANDTQSHHDAEKSPTTPPDRRAPQRQETDFSVLSADPEGNIFVEVAKSSAEGVWRPITTVMKFPMNLFVGIGNGFHNLPRLYGDTTVRRPYRITGVKSGMHAAGNELILGTWDAFSGVVTQPYYGAKDNGAIGFASGVGKGFGGLVLKECAAITAPLGFAMKGIYREAIKKRTPVAAIRSRRHCQGKWELQMLSEAQRLEAETNARKGWKVLGEMWNEAQKIKQGKLIPGGEEKEDAGLLASVTGRINLAREKEQWEKYGAFDNAERMQRFAEGRRRGLTLDQIVEDIQRDDEKKHEVEGVSSVEPPEHAGDTTAEKGRPLRQPERMIYEGHGIGVQESMAGKPIVAAC